MKKRINIFFFFAFALLIICGCKESTSQNKNNSKKGMNNLGKNNLQLATFGSGCFWCTEAIYERVRGVKSVVSGYSGGTKENPTYDEVCSGSTGHAEVIQLTYDPSIISYDELLEIFWKTHDPTTLNRQGADTGTQYRSVIFYHSDEQKLKAEAYKSELSNASIWKDPIVTEIVPFINFYKAENHHQNYYELNPNKGYCSFVITPKVEKFEKIFKDKLKSNAGTSK